TAVEHEEFEDVLGPVFEDGFHGVKAGVESRFHYQRLVLRLAALRPRGGPFFAGLSLAGLAFLPTADFLPEAFLPAFFGAPALLASFFGPLPLGWCDTSFRSILRSSVTTA